MDGDLLIRFEWMLIVVVLVLAIVELVALRRSQRRDREKAQSKGDDGLRP